MSVTVVRLQIDMFAKPDGENNRPIIGQARRIPPANIKARKPHVAAYTVFAEGFTGSASKVKGQPKFESYDEARQWGEDYVRDNAKTILTTTVRYV